MQESRMVDGAWVATKNTRFVKLFGDQPASGDWKSALAFTGKLKSLKQPGASDKRTFKAIVSSPGSIMGTYPVDITVEWALTTDS